MFLLLLFSMIWFYGYGVSPIKLFPLSLFSHRNHFPQYYYNRIVLQQQSQTQHCYLSVSCILGIANGRKSSIILSRYILTAGKFYYIYFTIDFLNNKHVIDSNEVEWNDWHGDWGHLEP